MNKLTCVNASNGLRVYNDGTAMLCCMSKLNLTNKEGVQANVKVDTINSVLNGKLAIEIKNALDNGIKHDNCQRCWDEEYAGLKSKRVRDNENYQFADTDNSLKIVELNLGTTCNLKCRICGPWASSQWNKEYLMIKQWKGEENDYKTWLHDLNHSYDDNSLFWEELKTNIHTVTAMDIYGGEPMLVKKQWEILQYSVDQGYSKFQNLHFNTNGTQFDWNKVSVIREFKSVAIDFSIDGIEKHFEYQRHPAKWNEVLDNIIKFQMLADKYQWLLTICVTVNMHNVWYLREILEFFHEKGIPVYLNFLHDPPRYNIRNLHETLKRELYVRYKDYGSDTINMWLKKAIDIMALSKSDHITWENFLEITVELDDIRGENFAKTFPEFYEAIQTLG
jgi:MoaA/NifB/PqqE/SkfB family radical SAM enzyme